MTNFEKFLDSCGGIERKTLKPSAYSGSYDIHGKVGAIIIPKDTYIEVLGTTTKGTIGKLIDFEPDLWSSNSYGLGFERIGAYNSVYIIEVEGRKKPSRIKVGLASVLKNHDGTTVWKRTTPKKRDLIPAHQNKFKQTLDKGVHVIGFTNKKVLAIGKVSRWTKVSVWVKTVTGRECQLYNPKECILVNEDEIERSLTFARLAGWSGAL